MFTHLKLFTENEHNFKEIEIRDLKQYLKERGESVRL